MIFVGNCEGNRPLTYQELTKAFWKKNQEIERLNNIINELEKYINECKNHCWSILDDIDNETAKAKRLTTRVYVYKELLDKLKELKEKE